MPKPCFPTTYSIDQIEQFKESYSTFEFRALSLRPEGIPLWQSRCADAGPSLLQKGFPPGACAVIAAGRFCQRLASGPLGRSDASGTPRDPSGALGPAPRVGGRDLGLATKKMSGDPSAHVSFFWGKVSYRDVGRPRTILSNDGIN